MPEIVTVFLLYVFDHVLPKEQKEYYPPTPELIEVDQRPLPKIPKQFI